MENMVGKPQHAALEPGNCGGPCRPIAWRTRAALRRRWPTSSSCSSSRPAQRTTPMWVQWQSGVGAIMHGLGGQCQAAADSKGAANATQSSCHCRRLMGVFALSSMCCCRWTRCSSPSAGTSWFGCRPRRLTAAAAAARAAAGQRRSRLGQVGRSASRQSPAAADGAGVGGVVGSHAGGSSAVLAGPGLPTRCGPFFLTFLFFASHPLHCRGQTGGGCGTVCKTNSPLSLDLALLGPPSAHSRFTGRFARHVLMPFRRGQGDKLFSEPSR